MSSWDSRRQDALEDFAQKNPREAEDLIDRRNELGEKECTDQKEIENRRDGALEQERDLLKKPDEKDKASTPRGAGLESLDGGVQSLENATPEAKEGAKQAVASKKSNPLPGNDQIDINIKSPGAVEREMNLNTNPPQRAIKGKRK